MMGKIAMGFKTMRFDGDGETFRRYKNCFEKFCLNMCRQYIAVD